MATTQTQARGLWPAIRSMAGVSLAVALFGLANGGNFALVAFGMSDSGASDSLVGLATSAYFTGTLTASLTAPAIVARLGHKRSFLLAAALAGLSTALLAAVEQVTLWPLVRIATGYAIGLYYVVVESWYNHATGNETRGRMLSFYETVRIASVAVGSFLLIALHGAFGLPVFLFAAVLYAAAVVPALRNRQAGPPPQRKSGLRLRPFVSKALLGLACCFVGGLTTAAIYGLLPLYGQQIGLATASLSLLVFLTHFGAIFIQFPSGLIADKVGRNTTILVATLLCAGLAGLIGTTASPSPLVLLLASAVVGGICHTTFTLGAIYVNDHLSVRSLTAGAAVLLISYDLGTIAGPLLAGRLMEALGPQGLYAFLGLTTGLLAGLALLTLCREGAGRPTG